ncbi:transcriptional repressor [Irineochytrium annulatum]|nr:transcriptional repressor [Irineochytrium annulatum]
MNTDDGLCSPATDLSDNCFLGPGRMNILSRDHDGRVGDGSPSESSSPSFLSTPRHPLKVNTTPLPSPPSGVFISPHSTFFKSPATPSSPFDKLVMAASRAQRLLDVPSPTTMAPSNGGSSPEQHNAVVHAFGAAAAVEAARAIAGASTRIFTTPPLTPRQDPMPRPKVVCPLKALSVDTKAASQGSTARLVIDAATDAPAGPTPTPIIAAVDVDVHSEAGAEIRNLAFTTAASVAAPVSVATNDLPRHRPPQPPRRPSRSQPRRKPSMFNATAPPRCLPSASASDDDDFVADDASEEEEEYIDDGEDDSEAADAFDGDEDDEVNNLPLSGKGRDSGRAGAKGQRSSVAVSQDAGKAVKSKGRKSNIIIGTTSDGTKWKRFGCTWDGCDKTFTTSGHLARHMRIHSGLKPYKCPLRECPSRFSRQDNMMQHYRTHIVKASGSALHVLSPSPRPAASESRPMARRSRLSNPNLSSVEDALGHENISDYPAVPRRDVKRGRAPISPKSASAPPAAGFLRADRVPQASAVAAAATATHSFHAFRTGAGGRPVRAESAGAQKRLEVQLFGMPELAAHYWRASRTGSSVRCGDAEQEEVDEEGKNGRRKRMKR